MWKALRFRFGDQGGRGMSEERDASEVSVVRGCSEPTPPKKEKKHPKPSFRRSIPRRDIARGYFGPFLTVQFGSRRGDRSVFEGCRDGSGDPGPTGERARAWNAAATRCRAGSCPGAESARSRGAEPGGKASRDLARSRGISTEKMRRGAARVVRRRDETSTLGG